MKSPSDSAQNDPSAPKNRSTRGAPLHLARAHRAQYRFRPSAIRPPLRRTPQLDPTISCAFCPFPLVRPRVARSRIETAERPENPFWGRLVSLFASLSAGFETKGAGFSCRSCGRCEDGCLSQSIIRHERHDKSPPKPARPGGTDQCLSQSITPHEREICGARRTGICRHAAKRPPSSPSPADAGSGRRPGAPDRFRRAVSRKRMGAEPASERSQCLVSCDGYPRFERFRPDQGGSAETPVRGSECKLKGLAPSKFSPRSICANRK